MADRWIWVCVDSLGNHISGEGFRVVKFATGVYDIGFNSAFDGLPAVILTQQSPFWTPKSSPPRWDGMDGEIISDGSSVSTRDNCILLSLRPDGCRVKTGDGGGAADDRNFTFIAFGKTK